MKSPVLAWLLLVFPLFSFGQKFRVKDMGVERGLSQSKVRAILQSRDGFMWLGTQDGLNRFDGYNYEVFRYKPNRMDVLGGNFIGALYQDRSGAIWIGDLDRGGITRYDPRRHSFSQIKDKEGKRFDMPLAEIVEDSAGNIWLGTLSGLYVIRGAVGEQVGVDSLKVQAFGPSEGWGAISEVIPAGKDGFWIGAYITSKTGKDHRGGIGRIDPSKMDMDTSLWNPRGKGFLPDNQINALLEGESGQLWIGTVDSGLFLCRKPSERPLVVEKIFHAHDHERGLGDELIRALEMDSRGNIWVATHHGLFIMPRERRDSLYHISLTNPEEFTLETIWAVSEDHFGNIWVGASKGCMQLIPAPSDFAHYYHIPQTTQSLVSNDVLTLLERKNGEIWIGTGDKGLTRMVPTAKGYDYLHYNQENGQLASNVILGFLEDESGKIWVSSFAGLFVFSFENQNAGAKASIQNYQHEPGNPHSLGSNYLYNVIQNDDASYWVSDYMAGPSLVRPTERGLSRKSFGAVKGDPYSLMTGYCNEVMKDQEGRIWALGRRGISLMYMKNGEFEGFRHIFNENLNEGKGLPGTPMSFYRDKEGALWVGANGLNRLTLTGDWEKSPKEGEVSQFLSFDLEYFGKDEGLANELIYFIQPDENDILWLGTNGGLVRFDPEKRTFRTYTKEDGFQSNEFSGDASFLGAGGQLYVGGINGFNIFHPDSLRDSPSEPGVIINRFLLFGEEVLPGKALKNSGFVLPEAIQTISNLELSYRDKVLGFEFGTDEFTAPEKQVFQYRLVGLDEGWISLNEQRALTLTNLPPGDYLLELRASNPDGRWSPRLRRLNIFIAAPWWQQNWFYLLLALLVAGLIYLGVVLRIRVVRREMRMQARLSQAKIEEREQTRAETSRDFHDEAGNRITKIGLYANLLREAVGDQSEPLSFIEKIEEHTRELSARMRDFIWVLDPRQDELAATLTRIRDFGVNLFEHTDIDFQARGEWSQVPKVRLEVQAKRHLLMIAKEAFHNALKYANCSHLQMNLRFDGEKMAWQIVDDGLGFNLEKASQGMGLRNMRMRAEELEADFEIASQPGMGTKISLSLDIEERESL